MCQNLYAGGRSEETETEPLYTTWTLSLTQLDTAALPLEKQIVGNLITKSFIDQLSSLNARIRSPDETAFYNEYAWSQARLESAKKLKSKRDERDALLFRGDTNWTYKNKIKTIDEEIKKLEEAFISQEAQFPLVAEQPNFSLTEKNLSGTYPEVPEAGMEYSFCREQKIDGFLSGSVSEYYGRIYLTIKLYALYSKSYIYEDFALFSVEDQQSVLSEMSARLKAVLSGIEPASIIVKAEPENTIILMNNMYAGRGNSGEKQQDAGLVTIETFADAYRSEDFQIDLFSGELADVFINLQPLAYKTFGLDTIDGFSSSVYLGSTFMGMTPLTLNLVPDQSEYIIMENERGESTSFIYDGSIPSAAVTLVPEAFNKKTVDDYRKKFYGAYGRFWISLPLAFIAYGVSSASVAASNASGGNIDMYNDALMYRNIFIGSAALAGGFLVETLIKLGIYLYQSNETDIEKL
ncbi:MAG: hypothetical protein LBV20_02555 [Treponema sp.]|jgi:hypothetical protein|nr:hypothetical protein [Treponema sp.]